MTGWYLEDNVTKLLRVVDQLKADPTARVHCEFVDTAITAVMYQTQNQRELLEYIVPESRSDRLDLPNQRERVLAE